MKTENTRVYVVEYSYRDSNDWCFDDIFYDDDMAQKYVEEMQSEDQNYRMIEATVFWDSPKHS